MISERMRDAKLLGRAADKMVKARAEWMGVNLPFMCAAGPLQVIGAEQERLKKLRGDARGATARADVRLPDTTSTSARAVSLEEAR